MTQLNSKSIKTILQEALSKDGDFLKEMVKKVVGRLSPELSYSKSTVSRITQLPS